MAIASGPYCDWQYWLFCGILFYRSFSTAVELLAPQVEFNMSRSKSNVLNKKESLVYSGLSQIFHEQVVARLTTVRTCDWLAQYTTKYGITWANNLGGFSASFPRFSDYRCWVLGCTNAPILNNSLLEQFSVVAIGRYYIRKIISFTFFLCTVLFLLLFTLKHHELIFSLSYFFFFSFLLQ